MKCAKEYAYSDDAPTWSNAYLWQPLIQTLLSATPPPARVFELGCGNGATARMMATLGYSVVGVDPSASGISIAKRYEGATLRFDIGATHDDLATRYGQFPVVVSLEVIEHCPSSREFINSFRSLLAPGGLGILSTPYHGYLKTLLIVASGGFDDHFDPLWEGGHLKFFSINKLRTLLKEAGLLKCDFHRVGRTPIVAKSVMAVVRNADKSA